MLIIVLVSTFFLPDSVLEIKKNFLILISTIISLIEIVYVVNEIHVSMLDVDVTHKIILIKI